MPFDLLTIARDVIAVDSRSSVSDRALVDVLIPLCRTVGLSTSLLREVRDGVPQFDLLAQRSGGSDRPPLLLNTHLDTVPPGDPALWTACAGDPFALTERDGHLHGLGAADVKLDFVCKLLALERLRAEPLERTVVLAGTYGEETGRYGAKLLARRRRPLPAMALVGEPSRLRPSTAHKGYVELRLSATADPRSTTPAAPSWRLTFEGVAAHSSQTHRGRSANDAALDALGALSSRPGFRLLSLNGGDLVNRVATRAVAVVALDRRPALESGGVEALGSATAPAAPPKLVDLLLAARASTRLLEAELRRFPTEGFDPPWSTVNNGLVRLEEGRLSHVCDVRRLSGEGPSRALDQHIARLEAALAAWGGEASLERALDSAPFAAPRGSAVVTALESVLAEHGLPAEPELKSGTTEASVYAGAGLDTVVFGPGPASGNIHRPNERVPLADLEAAVAIYADVIRRLCA